ncbi:MAG TPA: hypothetical protein VLE53_13195 [Gemmatimonadaceae bacterium]|nr:hypothetical protein [Gemmatimonadaceae bacterium]
MRGLIAGLGLMLVLEGCASSGTAASAPGSTQRTAARRSNVITAAELAESPQLLSVADAVRQLRPGWPQAQVYLDNDPFGPYQQLSQLTTRNAREIRYLTASEAQMKWGPRVQDIIQVVTR